MFHKISEYITGSAVKSRIFIIFLILSLVSLNVNVSFSQDINTQDNDIRGDIMNSLVDLPRNIGNIKDSNYNPGGRRVIIHIQDAHCNYYAQQSVKGIIDFFERKYGISMLFLEGGVGEYDLSPFYYIEDDSERMRTAEFFVNEGIINAAELAKIEAPDKYYLWGVEDTDLYLKNLEVYRKSAVHADAVKKYIKQIDSDLEKIKEHVYSKDLMDLDKNLENYKNNEMSFQEYMIFLLDKAVDKNIDISSFHDLALLKEVLEKEKSVDFKQASREREMFIEELETRMSANRIKELLVKIAELKTGTISQSDFYGYLENQGKRSNLSLEEFPYLKDYIEYISIYSSINKADMMDEVNDLENTVYERTASDPRQKWLINNSKRFILLKKAFSFSLTKSDYDHFKNDMDAFGMKAIIDFIHKVDPVFGLHPSVEENSAELDTRLREIKEFYIYSFERDDVFIENMKTKMDETGQNTVVLFTGGFHAENLVELFRKEGFSYVSIMPVFKSPEGYESPYFYILGGGSPLLGELIGSLPEIATMQVASIWNELGQRVTGTDSTDSLREAAIQLEIARRLTGNPGSESVVYVRLADGGIAGFRRDTGGAVSLDLQEEGSVPESDIINPADFRDAINATQGFYKRADRTREELTLISDGFNRMIRPQVVKKASDFFAKDLSASELRRVRRLEGIAGLPQGSLAVISHDYLGKDAFGVQFEITEEDVNRSGVDRSLIGKRVIAVNSNKELISDVRNTLQGTGYTLDQVIDEVLLHEAEEIRAMRDPALALVAEALERENSGTPDERSLERLSHIVAEASEIDSMANIDEGKVAPLHRVNLELMNDIALETIRISGNGRRAFHNRLRNGLLQAKARLIRSMLGKEQAGEDFKSFFSALKSTIDNIEVDDFKFASSSFYVGDAAETFFSENGISGAQRIEERVFRGVPLTLEGLVRDFFLTYQRFKKALVYEEMYRDNARNILETRGVRAGEDAAESVKKYSGNVVEVTIPLTKDNFPVTKYSGEAVEILLETRVPVYDFFDKIMDKALNTPDAGGTHADMGNIYLSSMDAGELARAISVKLAEIATRLDSEGRLNNTAMSEASNMLFDWGLFGMGRGFISGLSPEAYTLVLDRTKQRLNIMAGRETSAGFSNVLPLIRRNIDAAIADARDRIELSKRTQDPFRHIVDGNMDRYTVETESDLIANKNFSARKFAELTAENPREYLRQVRNRGGGRRIGGQETISVLDNIEEREEDFTSMVEKGSDNVFSFEDLQKGELEKALGIERMDPAVIGGLPEASGVTPDNMSFVLADLDQDAAAYQFTDEKTGRLITVVNNNVDFMDRINSVMPEGFSFSDILAEMLYHEARESFWMRQPAVRGMAERFISSGDINKEWFSQVPGEDIARTLGRSVSRIAHIIANAEQADNFRNEGLGGITPFYFSELASMTGAALGDMINDNRSLHMEIVDEVMKNSDLDDARSEGFTRLNIIRNNTVFREQASGRLASSGMRLKGAQKIEEAISGLMDSTQDVEFKNDNVKILSGRVDDTISGAETDRVNRRTMSSVKKKLGSIKDNQQSVLFVIHREGEAGDNRNNTIVSILENLQREIPALSDATERGTEHLTIFLPSETFSEELTKDPTASGTDLLKNWIENAGNKGAISDAGLKDKELINALESGKITVIKDDYSDTVMTEGMTSSPIPDIMTRILIGRHVATLAKAEDGESRKDALDSILRLLASRAESSRSLEDMNALIASASASEIDMEFVNAVLNALQISMRPIDYSEIRDIMEMNEAVAVSL